MRHAGGSAIESAVALARCDDSQASAETDDEGGFGTYLRTLSATCTALRVACWPAARLKDEIWDIITIVRTIVLSLR